VPKLPEIRETESFLAGQIAYKRRVAQQWAEHAADVPPERRVTLGKLDVWRYQFYRGKDLVCVPLYEHPETGAYVAVLPEDWGGPNEWAIAYVTPLSEMVGRGL
jgi:hypothetical protein